MAQRAAVKTTFEVSRTIQPIYVGGSVALSRNGRILATVLGEDALLTDLATGTELGRIEGVSLTVCCCRISSVSDVDAQNRTERSSLRYA